MKSTIALLLAASVQAIQFDVSPLLGEPHYPVGDTANNHWRKPWPEGIDNGDDDGAVLEAFSLPLENRHVEEPREKYPWSYDQDVIHTGKSLEIAEKQRGDKLTYDSVAIKRGRDMIFENNPMHEHTIQATRAAQPPAKLNPGEVAPTPPPATVTDPAGELGSGVAPIGGSSVTPAPQQV